LERSFDGIGVDEIGNVAEPTSVSAACRAHHVIQWMTLATMIVATTRPSAHATVRHA
jgi:hypothetical protein